MIKSHEDETAILKLLEADLLEEESLNTVNRLNQEQNMIRQVVNEELTLPQIVAIFQKVSNLATRNVLRNVLDKLLLIGYKMKILSLELFEDEKDKSYIIEIVLHRDSFLSKEGETKIIKECELEHAIKLAFSQTYLHPLNRRIIAIKIDLK